MMTDREKEEFIQTTKQLLINMRNAILEAINELPDAKSNLQDVIKQWKEKRQVLNNKNIGVIISFDKPSIGIYPLHNDEKRDMGQKNYHLSRRKRRSRKKIWNF